MGLAGLADILGIARGATCSKNPEPNEPPQTIEKLRQQIQLKSHASLQPFGAPTVRVQQEARPRALSRANSLPNIATGPPGSELQIATSDTGQIVVIGSNGGVSFSVDYGDSFNPSAVNTPFNGGDPTLGTGISGQFYLEESIPAQRGAPIRGCFNQR